MDNTEDTTRIINMVILIIAGTALMIILFAVYSWMRGQRKKRPLDDIDWDKEKERLLLLASEKKVSRKLGKEEGGKEDLGNGAGSGD
jgi:hypothetical protein